MHMIITIHMHKRRHINTVKQDSMYNATYIQTQSITAKEIILGIQMYRLDFIYLNFIFQFSRYN